MTPLPISAGLPSPAVDMRDASALPLYRRDRQKAYWFAALPESKAVYLKYNSCREMKDRPFAAFVKDVFAAVESVQAERLIVDLRNNGGGDSSLFEPFFRAFSNAARVNRKGRLFVVLGRQTFSSAILNAIDLRKRTPAVFVGEPTGGKPNHFGEVKTLKLPRTKLEVSYSTKYFQQSYEDTPSLMPDVTIELSIDDYRARRDPVLEAILSGKLQ
jgi:C-terminal processing protease CtpA/Prc